MPEKPPSIPPEEDFSFVRNAEAEEFELTWTSKMRERIETLFKEVHWPAGIMGSEKEIRPMIEAFVSASKESQDVLIEHLIAKGHEQTKAEKFGRGAMNVIFSDFCKIRDALARSRTPSGLGTPVGVGNVLLRMKRILSSEKP